ncbi:MAG: glutamine-hydrolyzing GMP synthase [Clostridiales bacterium]|nr:glutamine-hydrolyzing GMP synthase [Clostridiales bacterium]
MERIVILDFGAQYNQLIARRVREQGVFSELLPPMSSVERIKGDGLSGVILSGSPDSVYAEDGRRCLKEVFELGVPVLGICYGMQLMTYMLGGRVEKAPVREYAGVTAHFESSPLFEGMPDSTVWMSHNDMVTKMPEGFSVISSTADCPIAGMQDVERRLFAVQFHPEVAHTEYCARFFRNFTHGVCGCEGKWSPEGLMDELVESIRKQVGERRVVAGLSGGVDSSVAAALVSRAIGDRLTCIFVDHGLLRKNEADEVMHFYRENMGLNVIEVDAKEFFLSQLAGVTEPERKRKIIGESFVRVFEREAKKIGGAELLLQGTIYPDVIESGTGGASVIKSHHNVGGLPEKFGFELLEPLRPFFKDEVRAIGEALGMPKELVWRQPFPGPGLGIRVIGDVTEEKLNILRESDYILRDEIKKAGLDREIWQYFTVFTGMRSVGVMGDSRTYDYAIGVRAVVSTDAMTVEFAEIPHKLLRRISNRIIAEVPHVNRVVYDITDKPPGTIEWE